MYGNYSYIIKSYTKLPYKLLASVLPHSSRAEEFHPCVLKASSNTQIF